MHDRQGKKKNLLLVINTLRMGGAERFAINMANWFAAHGIHVTLVVFEKEDCAFKPDPRVHTIFLHRRCSWDLIRVVWGLRRIIRERNPDAVLSTMVPTTFMTSLAYIGRKKQPRLIGVESCFQSARKTSYFHKVITRMIYTIAYMNCSALISLTDAMSNDLCQNFGVRKELFTVIHNPVDIERCTVLAQTAVTHPFFSDRSIPLVVSCARLTEPKDFPTLLHALAILMTHASACRLLILGDGEEKENLLALRDSLELQNMVDFVGCVDNPYAYMSRADIFVLSTFSEGFPTVVIEAMACGAPVICSDCPSGPRDIISDRENGILVPPGDADALADAIRTLIEDEPLRTRIAHNGYIHVSENLTIDTIGAQYYRVLFDEEYPTAT